MDQKLYPDYLAEKFKEDAGKPYRPSNGSEGMDFMDRWCEQCVRDGSDEGCEIMVLTMAYDEDDEEYPKEWIYGEDGQPKCTAFERKANQ